jgi:hypothetical protein
MTGFGTVETAIDAMKQGAYDYILKPFKVEEIVHIVQRGLDKRRLAAENLRLREALSLYKVSEAIAASLSLDEGMATVTDSALNEARADVVFTWLDNAEGGYFQRSVECSHMVSQVRDFGENSPDPCRFLILSNDWWSSCSGCRASVPRARSGWRSTFCGRRGRMPNVCATPSAT